MPYPTALPSMHDFPAGRQRTLKSAIGCVGIGLHSGLRTTMRLLPAAADNGIAFRRTDLGIDIPAQFDHVIDTRLSTVLGIPGGDPAARVGTVEHLMAAFAAFGIDNAVVEIDGPELPAFDGSASSFAFLIECAGRQVQNAPRRVIEVLRPVRVGTADGYAELLPSTGEGLDLSLCIDFAAAAIGRQELALTLNESSFRRELAEARTFAMAGEIAQLQAAGLARGGSLDNAVVVDDAMVLNPGGLRMKDEFVRHKLTDAVGDLALAGAALKARFRAHRTGHALNNQLLRALFADGANWRLSAPVRMGSSSAQRLPAAASPV